MGRSAPYLEHLTKLEVYSGHTILHVAVCASALNEHRDRTSKAQARRVMLLDDQAGTCCRTLDE